MYSFNVREEQFGATVFDLDKGKRYYISNLEFTTLKEKGIFPEDLNIKSGTEIKYTTKDNISNLKCFSFADIAYIELTRKCNLRCKHCLNNSGIEMSNQLNFDDFRKLILDFSNAGIQEIRFTGGEPLVFERIFELLEMCNSLGIYTSIGTNGTLLTKDVVEKLKKANLKKAIVSLDGTEEKHDFIRGKGNYKKTLDGVNNLLETDIDVRINSVIMKDNIDDVIELAKLLNERHQALFIRRFIESGRGYNLINNTLTKDDYIYVKEQLKKELEGDNYVDGHYLREKGESINSRMIIPFKIKNGCKAGERALIITPEGNIHLCGFLAAQGFPPVGNVKNVDDWNDYWYQLHQKNLLKNLEENLEIYNSEPGIQETNCLAYVQRALTLKGTNRL